jgi:type II secretory pathway component PulF
MAKFRYCTTTSLERTVRYTIEADSEEEAAAILATNKDLKPSYTDEEVHNEEQWWEGPF